jgi:hypothetical protein
LGASRPRVSEYMKEFDHKGLVARRARQLIVKRDRLENFLLQTHSGYREESGPLRKSGFSTTIGKPTKLMVAQLLGPARSKQLSSEATHPTALAASPASRTRRRILS